MPTRISGSHAEVQYATTGGVGARTRTYGGALTAGTLLVVTVTTDRAATVTVSDGTNGAYTASGAGYINSRLSQWHFPNNASAGTPTVSVTPNVDCELSISVDEYSGAATASAVRAFASNTGASVTSGTGGVVAAFPGDLVVLSFDFMSSPVILQLTPSTGAIGAAVTITGLNFGTTQGVSTVKFNGVLATVNSWTATSITTNVPVGAATGLVVVRVNGVDSAGVTFTISSGEVYDYYVSTAAGASDGNNGLYATVQGGANGPFATIAHALVVASGALSGTGKTIAVLGGTYNEAVDNPAATGSSWTNKLRVVNYQSQSVLLRPLSGTHVLLFAGSQSYVEFDGISMDASFVSGNAIKVEAGFGFNPHHVRVQHADIAISNTSANLEGATILLVAAAVGQVGANEFLHLVVHGGPVIETQNLPRQALYIQSSHNLFDDVEVYDIAGGAMEWYNGYAGTTVTGNIVRNCYFHDFTRVVTADVSKRLIPIVMYGANITGNAFYNNVIDTVTTGVAGAFVAGVYISGGCKLTYFWNNTIYNVGATGTPGTGFLCDDASVTGQRINTVAWGCGTNVNDSSTMTKTTNYSSTTDPKFVSPLTGDFNVQATSPLRNAGTTITPVTVDGTLFEVTTDKAGTARPKGSAYDIGAYEYVE